MRFTGEIMRNTGDQEEETPTVTRQIICLVLNLYSGPSAGEADKSQTRRFVKYPKKSICTVTWLSVVQLVCGLVMLGSQIAPIYWNTKLIALSDGDVSLQYKVVDNYGGGVWCGISIFVSGVIGLIASRKNFKAWIVAHLILNLFAVVFAITLIVFTSLSTYGIVRCKIRGSRVSNGRDKYYDTSTQGVSKDIFGETLTFGGNGNRDLYLHCVNGIFTIWIVLEALMIVSAVVTLFTSLWLLVKNFKATCPCCQECCTPENNISEDDEEILANE